MIESVTAHETRLTNGVVIAVHSNSYRSVRGRTLLPCIFDEIAFWRDNTSAGPDIETYRAVLPSLCPHRRYINWNLHTLSLYRFAAH